MALHELQGIIAEALRHHQAGRMVEAEQLYRRVLAEDSRHADALHLLGLIARKTGRKTEAVELIGQAIAIDGAVAVYHYNMGNALRDVGRVDAAIAAYGAAIHLKPDYAKAYHNLAQGLKGAGRLAEAVAAYRAALRLEPEDDEAYFLLGNTLFDLRRFPEAAHAFRAALCVRPDHAEAQSNLGNTRRKMGSLDAAIPAYERAIRLRPAYAEAYYNRGVALHELGELAAAIGSYRQALLHKPDLPAAHYNLGNSLLLAGRFQEGWPEHEWRLPWRASVGIGTLRAFARPQWTGQEVLGRVILLHAELGLGDSLFFSRYVPLVVALGAKVVLEVQPPLLGLLAPLRGLVELVGQGDPLPDFDFHCPLMSLPLAFGTTAETIPPPLPGIAPAMAPPDRGAFRIGLAWEGSPRHGDPHRSLPISGIVAALGRVPGVRLVSLQKEHGPEGLARLPAGAIEIVPLDSFTDTAALMMGLDLVVAIDCVVAHLAGTLGRPLWVPLQKVAFWPWGVAGDRTPWYPTARLFRQTARGDWGDVFHRLEEAAGCLRSSA